MTNDPAESSFMTAAEKQIDRLVEEATILRAAARWHKIQIRTLSVVTALVLIGAGFLGYITVSQHNLTKQLQQGSIASCQAGNTQRESDTRIWDALGSIFLQDNKGNAVVAEQVKQFEKYIGSVDYTHNCTSLYGQALGAGNG